MDERRWALHSPHLLLLVTINRVGANILLMTPNCADDNYAHQMGPDEHMFIIFNPCPVFAIPSCDRESKTLQFHN